MGFMPAQICGDKKALLDDSFLNNARGANMEVKRVSGTPFLPVESTTPEPQPQPKISRGVAETTDSFEAAPPQSANDLFLEFQRRQFAGGNFTQAAVSRTSAPSQQQIAELTTAIKDAVLGSESSSPEEIPKTLQQAMAVLATIPNVGPIIAAVLAAVAAVIMEISQMLEKQKEQEAAQKEKEQSSNPLEKLKDVLAQLIQSLNPSDRD